MTEIGGLVVLLFLSGVFSGSETALVAADGAAPLWTLNPLHPWSLVQQERGSQAETANVLWALDLTWHARDDLVLYGQVLVDDLQIRRFAVSGVELDEQV